jgi:hypothetical protein
MGLRLALALVEGVVIKIKTYLTIRGRVDIFALEQRRK